MTGPGRTIKPGGHTHAYDDIEGTPDVYTKTESDARYALIAHQHPASDIISGTFADARIAQSNVTQWGDPRYALIVHTHAASDITSGTFADARIASSNVTQWQSALSILFSQLTSTPTTLAGYGITDAYTKTASDARYAALVHTHDAADIVSGTIALARISGLTDAQVSGSAAIQWSKISKTSSSLADLATRSAADLSSGTLPSARLSGSYTGVTLVGTLSSLKANLAGFGGTAPTTTVAVNIGGSALSGSPKTGINISMPAATDYAVLTQQGKYYIGSITSIGEGGPVADRLLYVNSATAAATAGTSQYGIYSDLAGAPDATVNVIGVYSKVSSQAGTASTAMAAYYAAVGTLGTFSSNTDYYGLYVEDITGTGSTNSWAIRSMGTSQSALGGSLSLGKNTAPAYTLDMLGDGYYSGTIYGQAANCALALFGTGAITKTSVSTANPFSLGAGSAAKIQSAAGDAGAGQSLIRWSNDNRGGAYILTKSRTTLVAGTGGTRVTVASGDNLGVVLWGADDGTDLFTQAARVQANVDGTVSTSRVPTRLSFFTTPGLADDDIQEAMRIGTTGAVGIRAAQKLFVDGIALTGDTYIYESAANVLDTFVGGVNAQQLTATALSIPDGSAFYFGGNATHPSLKHSATGVDFQTHATTATDYRWLGTGGAELLRYAAAGYMLNGTTVTTGASAGDYITKNATGLKVINNAGSGSYYLATGNTSDQVYVDPNAKGVKFGLPLVTLGTTTLITLGKTGGSGPATAAQNSWCKFFDSGGAAFYVPVWK